jgi:GT2 family glycosyltransferase
MRWGYDLRIVSTIPGGYPYEPNWYKIDLILESIRSGQNSYIIYLDADAIIADFDVDLCSALPDYAWLGLVIHPYAWKRTIWHWNNGVMYIRCSPESLNFFETVKSLAGTELNDRSTFIEQGTVNHLLLNEPRYQSGLVILTHHWNVNIFNQPNEGAIVAAWHGSGPTDQRAESMREWADNHPYPTVSAERGLCMSPELQNESTNGNTMPNAAIGIVMPVRNCLELTKAAVASIRTRHPFHLYFVDDHSNKETKNWLSTVPNATIFTDPEHSTGVAWNWNLGISAALIDGMTHVLIVNNDIILHPDAIDSMVRRTNLGDAALVSGIGVGCNAPEDILDLIVNDSSDGGNADYSCFMITAKTISKVGWFDEHYRGAYYEDTDYRAAIYHFGEREVCTHAAQYYHYISSAIKEDPNLNEAIQNKANQNHSYFRSKWGRDPINDIPAMKASYYPAPFNSPDSAVKKNELLGARLADLYAAAVEEGSDISEHISLLYKLASCVDHVTNLSSVGVESATAFVQAKPEHCAIYCSLNSPGIVRLKCAAHFAGLDYIFAEFKRDIEIEQTDLLLIDAIHTEDVISCELSRYACRVKKYLIFHDTETFGLVGELPGSRGIWPAISNYMREHPEWQLLQHYSNCNGLTIFERLRAGK